MTQPTTSIQREVRELPRAARLLVLHDLGDDAFDALAQGLEFAALTPSTVVHVAASTHGDTVLAQLPSAHRMGALRNHVGLYLREVWVRDSQEETRLAFHLLELEPSTALSRLAFMLEVDMLIVPSNEHPTPKDLLFGTLEQRLVASAPCPVLVVRPRLTDAIPDIEEADDEGPPASRLTLEAAPRPRRVPRTAQSGENLPLTIHGGAR